MIALNFQTFYLPWLPRCIELSCLFRKFDISFTVIWWKISIAIKITNTTQRKVVDAHFLPKTIQNKVSTLALVPNEAWTQKICHNPEQQA